MSRQAEGVWEGGVAGRVSAKCLSSKCLSPVLSLSFLLIQPLCLYLKGENSQEFSPTFSERIFIAGSKQYR